ncbi:unnamed protein product [Heterobilharzia americana]|nr:unnamed protein product [Heterobilharzia americana]CAH8577671.1 unnamed protein product [Heterobilharzia americana]
MGCYYYGCRISQFISTALKGRLGRTTVLTSLGSTLSGVFYFSTYDCKHVQMKSMKTNVRPLTLEERFRTFASLQVHGVVLMTPSDFLRSLVNDQRDVKMTVTSDSGFVERIMMKASKGKHGSRFFRNLQNDGIITFSEYLFLLHILTKSPSGFEIAFKMLDRDSSGSVDAKEFMILNHIITENTKYMSADECQKCDLMLPEEHAYNTTLMTHLFGFAKTQNLSFSEFKKFMQNVQTEALEVEFQQYSLGTSTITPVDFARILLRYTKVSASEYDAFIMRLEKRVSPNIAITFSEFQKFFMFLNCLDDFVLAVKMYTIAGQPISLLEFKRAIKACTGDELSSDVLAVVFALFDNDEDNCLSYQEFIHIMRERHSGGLLRTSKNDNIMNMYRKCLKRELQSSMN